MAAMPALFGNDGRVCVDVPSLERLIRAEDPKSARCQDALFILGYYHQLGSQGLAKDDARACDYWRRAEGHARASYCLGNAHAYGVGVDQDDARAASYYEVAAAAGVPEAQSNLGLFYAQGRGVAKNPEAAATWAKKAADQGVPQSQYSIAIMLARGDGIKQDFAKASVLRRSYF
mmetsp:Transcript_29641/g.96927  ORF Transcript_29641/g.96927 Transcript_29641/m.96927 type:complete len:175 (+) Transcript_29641:13-537(+)